MVVSSKRLRPVTDHGPWDDSEGSLLFETLRRRRREKEEEIVLELTDIN